MRESLVQHWSASTSKQWHVHIVQIACEQAHAGSTCIHSTFQPCLVTVQRHNRRTKTQSMAYFDSTCKSSLVGRRNLQGNHALARCCVNIAIGVKATSSTSWTEYQICRKSSTTTCHSFASLEVSSPARLLQPVCTQGKQVAPIVPRNSDKTSCCSVLMRRKFFWFWSSHKAPRKQQTSLESSSHHQCSSPAHRTRFPQ